MATTNPEDQAAQTEREWQQRLNEARRGTSPANANQPSADQPGQKPEPAERGHNQGSSPSREEPAASPAEVQRQQLLGQQQQLESQRADVEQTIGTTNKIALSVALGLAIVLDLLDFIDIATSFELGTFIGIPLTVINATIVLLGVSRAQRELVRKVLVRVIAAVGFESIPIIDILPMETFIIISIFITAMRTERQSDAKLEDLNERSRGIEKELNVASRGRSGR